MNKHPHANLGKFLHAPKTMKAAVAAQKTHHPAPSQVTKTTSAKGATHGTAHKGPKMKPWS